jgi:methylthioribose-1-phosphate isomerase
MLGVVRADHGSADGLRAALLEEAHTVFAEDDAACRRLGMLGAELIPDGAGVLTHCNAGGLATSGYGTALGVIRAAHEDGKRIHVYADETRPLLQGARLTAWELKTLGIPATLLCDNMAASHLARGLISLAVVGADRIAANGDVANKVGTLGVAVLCHHFGVPFYVAAPVSTLDLSLPSGAEIPIEERNAEEVRAFGGTTVAPELGEAFSVANPAFDVTPAELVSAIITERGIARPPYTQSLAGLAASAGA